LDLAAWAGVLGALPRFCDAAPWPLPAPCNQTGFVCSEFIHYYFLIILLTSILQGGKFGTTWCYTALGELKIPCQIALFLPFGSAGSIAAFSELLFFALDFSMSE